MTRRDRGRWPIQPRSEVQVALSQLGSVVMAALAVCALVAAWQIALAFGVIP